MIRVNDTEIDWKPAMTVGDALRAMKYDFHTIVVTVNDEFVPKMDHETTQVPDGADVKAIHVFHGG